MQELSTKNTKREVTQSQLLSAFGLLFDPDLGQEGIDSCRRFCTEAARSTFPNTASQMFALALQHTEAHPDRIGLGVRVLQSVNNLNAAVILAVAAIVDNKSEAIHSRKAKEIWRSLPKAIKQSIPGLPKLGGDMFSYTPMTSHGDRFKGLCTGSEPAVVSRLNATGFNGPSTPMKVAAISYRLCTGQELGESLSKELCSLCEDPEIARCFAILCERNIRFDITKLESTLELLQYIGPDEQEANLLKKTLARIINHSSCNCDDLAEYHNQLDVMMDLGLVSDELNWLVGDAIKNSQGRELAEKCSKYLAAPNPPQSQNKAKTESLAEELFSDPEVSVKRKAQLALEFVLAGSRMCNEWKEKLLTLALDRETRAEIENQINQQIRKNHEILMKIYHQRQAAEDTFLYLIAEDTFLYLIKVLAANGPLPEQIINLVASNRDRKYACPKQKSRGLTIKDSLVKIYMVVKGFLKSLA